MTHAPYTRGSAVSAMRRSILSTFLRLSLVVLAISLSQHPILAQSYSRVELGAQGTSLYLVDPTSNAEEKGGFGTRLTYNFSPIVALDIEGDFFPSNSLPGPQRGGRAFQALAGPKAGWRWERVSLFVKARPGVVNFNNVLKITTGIQSNGVPFFAENPGGHRTHLALDLGGVLEIDTTRRTLIRIDAGEMLIRYDDRVYPIPGTTGAVNVPGIIGNSLLVSAGFSYRMGDIEEQQVTIKNARRWEVGAQYGLLSLGRGELVGSPSFVPFYLGDDPGFGGRVTYNFNRWLALDSAVSYFYHDPHVGDAQRGGKIIQGCFGPKAGLRTQRVGVFLKIRPGFLSLRKCTRQF